MLLLHGAEPTRRIEAGYEKNELRVAAHATNKNIIPCFPTMHPPLTEHQHPGCFDVILALEQCHEAGFLNKFTGACNDKKKAVDQCLKEEV